MRRRLVAIRPDPSGARTVDARSSFSSEAYEILAPHITELLPELYEAYRQTPNQEIFDIEVAPNGSMRLIDGAMNLLRQNEGYGYFAIRRRDGENGRPTFTIESLHLAPAMESAGWGRLLRAFLP
jgi:hypothetical protein